MKVARPGLVVASALVPAIQSSGRVCRSNPSVKPIATPMQNPSGKLSHQCAPCDDLMLFTAEGNLMHVGLSLSFWLVT